MRKAASEQLSMLMKYSDPNQQPTELKLWQAYKQQGGALSFPEFIDRNNEKKSDTNDTKNYEAYKADSEARGVTPLSFFEYTQQMRKAGANSTNIDMKGEGAQAQESGKLAGQALTKPVAEIADRAEAAQQKMLALNAMETAVNNPNLYQGWNADKALTLNKVLSGVGQIFGVEPDEKLKDENSAGEMLDKFSRQLAGAQAKSIGGARVTNFELDQFIKANPNLLMTQQGNQRLIGIMKQMAQRELDLSSAAQDHLEENGAKSSISKFRKAVIEPYDQAHPIIDPISGKQLSSNTNLSDLDKSPDSSASPNTSPAAPIPAAQAGGYPDGSISRDPKTNQRYMKQNGQWVPIQ
jgi:hypothetical protein